MPTRKEMPMAFSRRSINNGILFFLLFLSLGNPSIALKKSYVVYLGSHAHSLEDTIDHEKIADSHHDILGSILGSKEKAKDAIFHSYTKSINGFAANLDEDEAKELAEHTDVVSMFADRGRRVQSTHVWRFLGLEKGDNPEVSPKSLWGKTNFGKDMIIGVIDSGVDSTHPSFNDAGIGPIPTRWKGICQNDTVPMEEGGVRCNRKLIGARYFLSGYINQVIAHKNDPDYDHYLASLWANHLTPVEDLEHGTSCLGLAGGSPIFGTHISNEPPGVAKGGAPMARLASYKVGGQDLPDAIGSEFFDTDIIAGFDAAIHDGVDVISISLGSDDADPVANDLDDGVSIGSFHALKEGIPTVACAGNYVQDDRSHIDSRLMYNAIPWAITVGATIMDREFVAELILGNKIHIKGAAMYTDEPLPKGKYYPLIDGKDAGLPGREANASRCEEFLDPKLVEGKIVVCRDVGGAGPGAASYAVRKAGGVGVVCINEDGHDEIRAELLNIEMPSIQTPYRNYEIIKNYILSTKNPEASITRTRVKYNASGDPIVASFSYPGPNKNNPEILKPDIVAPGSFIILAPKTGEASIFVEGTSAATPIVAGVVALLKSLHPDWSPSAIKSAIMTTATRVTKRTLLNYMTDGKIPPNFLVDATPFDAGAGQINPQAAADPGLVYDIAIEDYLNLMCSKGFSPELIARFAEASYSCPSQLPRVVDMNYPAIVVPDLVNSTTVVRKLKNVGTPGSYKVKVEAPPEVDVLVEPATLVFSAEGEEKTFNVTFAASKPIDYSFGSLTWDDGVHRVSSPLAVRTKV